MFFWGGVVLFLDPVRRRLVTTGMHCQFASVKTFVVAQLKLLTIAYVEVYNEKNEISAFTKVNVSGSSGIGLLAVSIVG